MSNVTDIINEAPEQPAAQETAVATTQAQPVAVATGQTGVVDRAMLKLPYLNITQKTGDLGDEFGPGKLIFNQSVELGGELDPQFTVLGNKVGWQENLKFGESEDLPRTWGTREEAIADGITQFEYGADGSAPEALPYCQATGILSVKADLGGFREGPDGRYYAAAVWFLAKTAFGSAGRRMVSQFATLGADADVSVFPWALATKDKNYKTNKYYVPVIKPLPHHEEEVHSFIKNFLNS